ncbi:hypothetical protein K437DRAFT_254780 [Tilletiaria anomala UBC 951]|uniref:Uncharacterized protein n=1 Tax=Tilletiaria anomala (strain ATCC 24038 / CBS 436.72 / UBC 951) TaxID=1037660 RepID=A0A066WBT1_TILAU|nr:uncharacterized protein K437DRAFT_254780 [Tilletiaria anomala UBC 951]KDN51372.1 hypothetical protein K437DRAFT_254780 [Tilletiaria anomala UBC 951]
MPASQSAVLAAAAAGKATYAQKRLTAIRRPRLRSKKLFGKDPSAGASVDASSTTWARRCMVTASGAGVWPATKRGSAQQHELADC